MDTIIPESTEQEVSVEQENATFFVLGDAAYTSEIIEEYNRNAVNKTNEFNANSDTKVKEYNTNAKNKTTAFDNNYDTKVAAFNKNAETQTETFNSNAITKENSFNANATTSIQNYNANAEQKLYEFNANALSYEEGITDNSNRIKRLETDIFDSGEANGSSINIKDSTLAEFQELSVDGVCEQETTNGENLFNANVCVNSCSVDKDTITITDDTTDIYIQGAFAYNENNKFMTLEAGNYYIKSTNPNVKISMYSDREALDSSVTQPRALTTTTNFGGIRIRSIDGSSLKNVSFEIKVGKDKFTDEKYTGGQPSPSPEFPQPISVIENSLKITSCNENIYFNDKEIHKFTSTNSNWKFLDGKAGADTSDSSKTLYKAKVEKGKTYTFTTNIKAIEIVPTALMYDDNTLVTSIKGTDLTYNYTFISKKDCYVLLRMYVNSGISVEVSNVMLVEGSNVPFEQHLETQIEANLPEGEFIGKINDTYKDTLKVGYNETDGQYHLKLYKNLAKVVLDGSENGWDIKTNPRRFDISFANLGITNIKNGTNNSDTSNYRMNTHFYYSDNNQTYGSYYAYDGWFVFFDNETVVASLDDFKNWLSTHNTEIYYVLDTSYVVDLGIVDMPLSYNEVTNLFTDSDLMPTINAKYYRNFINTIQNLQVNEKALKEELVDINSRLSALESANANVTSESEVIE